jgi:uncharacterized protein YeaO (DUF488 family)
MKIYTSYFDNMKNLENITFISICGKAPEWYDGVQYKRLAPKYEFFMEWKKNKDNDYYIEHFNKEVLDCLSAKEVYNDLERLSGGKDCVLLCYEKSSDFCHRHLVSEWLNKELNLDVKEITF